MGLSKIFFSARLFAITVTIFLASNSFAQVGFRLDWLYQNNIMGHYFKPTIMPQIQYVRVSHQGFVKEIAGLGYTSQKAKLDVFPEYYTKEQTNGDIAVVPQDTHWKKSSLVYFYTDVYFRCMDLKKFKLFVGPGLIMGGSHYEYDLVTQTDKTNFSNTLAFFGARANISFQYNLSDHFQLYAAATRNFMIGTGSVNFGSTAVGIGVNYIIETNLWDSDY